ncbi:MAG: c-type cytochrome, partial [Congregibacter sp.]|nr:c-type cytochrome [Congregibacter sp.]
MNISHPIGTGLVGLLLLFGPLGGHAHDATTANGDAQGFDAKGFDAKDYEYCLVCHGSLGQGNPAVHAPVLAGMEDWSLRNQLQAFRDGWRGTHPLDLIGMEMRPVAMALDPSETSAVIQYLQALPAQSAPITVQGDIEAGKTLYKACATCHGISGEGNEELQAPALAYQDGAYLLRQLTHFRDGIRGSHPEDRRGARM